MIEINNEQALAILKILSEWLKYSNINDEISELRKNIVKNSIHSNNLLDVLFWTVKKINSLSDRMDSLEKKL